MYVNNDMGQLIKYKSLEGRSKNWIDGSIWAK
jgi:hypothetical protein